VPISRDIEAYCVKTELLVNSAAASMSVSRELIIQTQEAIAESRRLLERNAHAVRTTSLSVYLIRGFGETR
jgi:hypothetical protein